MCEASYIKVTIKHSFVLCKYELVVNIYLFLRNVLIFIFGSYIVYLVGFTFTAFDF